ncbi:2TM domain-containing protein [Pseudoalteromonas phenolica]|uniref:2TM domain-containing protein n=1 Tax=Pseudoalteromonas phenolica TaxID=161398 RepID=A0A0S2K5Y3_9GAMM|nr:2TM domain-containing protein [Pseudoalteromonas phenolica]ALO43808.1 hypothetical protein PP2015_3333 [Pseudoalteromonas phenolica]MBE0355014.1 hypothetical protein [Pseudoalteromonas phenolica O-BC30]RXE95539.1 hypothetical protein D9981_14875 [Pseudoalteromonas phenolica O-BC30]TMO54376.1 hypothetical protein CWC21_15690 [Pseudoalteromonas phenolica]|tara:strand:- start:1105 stop:1383 length:279 start_codon:yes stop_codon:yes gene_type:complete
MKTDIESYQDAMTHVARIKSFYKFVLKGLMLSVMLILLNAVTNSDYMWSLWVLAGWAVIAAVKWVSTFGFASLFDKRWEEKQIAKSLSQTGK